MAKNDTRSHRTMSADRVLILQDLYTNMTLHSLIYCDIGDEHNKHKYNSKHPNAKRVGYVCKKKESCQIKHSMSHTLDSVIYYKLAEIGLQGCKLSKLMRLTTTDQTFLP